MSTIKTIVYNDPAQSAFVYNTAEVQIDGSGAMLKRRTLPSNQLVIATGRVQQNADITPTAFNSFYMRGNATWSAGAGYNCDDVTPLSYLSLNDDSVRDGVTPIPNTSHFNFKDIGTVRFKYKPAYSGPPSVSRYIFTTGVSTEGSTKGQGSLITMTHDSGTGRITVITRNATDTGTTSSPFGNWFPVAGTWYEFEFNYNSVAGTAQLFIDGNVQSSNSVRIGVNDRDYFYFGNYYSSVGGWTSEGSFRDIEIFNTIQHTSSFVSEIPRVVNLYPLESRIEPQDFSTSEGLENFENVTSPLVGDSNIRYCIKVENSLYRISGGMLISSNGTYAESNTVSEIVADKDLVTTFIQNGARLTFSPILYSGVLGLYTPNLISDTLTYDFFTVPVFCETCTLYGFIKDNCDPVDATVRVYSKKPFLSQGNLISIDETVTTDIAEGGSFEVELVIPDQQTVYKFEATWTDSQGVTQTRKYNILIPNAPTALLENVVQ